MEARYLTLICEAERWERKGMMVLANLYWARAAAVLAELELSEI